LTRYSYATASLVLLSSVISLRMYCG